MADFTSIINSVLGPSNNGGFTLVNTLILIVITFPVLIWVVGPLLRKHSVKLDYRIMLFMIPYLVFGTLIRTFQDSGLLPYTLNPLELGFYTHTPGLWYAIIILMIASVFAGRKLFPATEKDDRAFGIFGTILLVSALAFYFTLPIDLAILAGTILAIAIVSAIAIFLASKFLKGFADDGLNSLAVIGQAIDGVSSYIATTVFTCSEQHFVSNAIIGSFPLAFPIIKIALIVAIVHIVDAEIKDEFQRNYIKVIVVSLGFITGTRNVWTVAAGNCG
ncbi:MAG: DUF63 family protein [Candidatus Diapherotrites archaeon]|uniref:DUF63 family protein n=1 Tax=Candidatus Iainarchaeum sp. TaxID=3101447 RepID=A0A8T3YHH8_9ARCH|nr:DUF63 family protein [Candidatus Diapherotrites archaeon]